MIAVVIAIAAVFAFGSTAVMANGESETFDLYVKHNINGRSLGLEKHCLLTFMSMVVMCLPLALEKVHHLKVYLKLVYILSQ